MILHIVPLALCLNIKLRKRKSPSPYLVKSCHPSHVDPVHVYLHADPPEHVDDHLPISLLDALIKNNLVRESHSSLSWVLSCKKTCSSRHFHLEPCRVLRPHYILRQRWSPPDCCTVSHLPNTGNTIKEELHYKVKKELNLNFTLKSNTDQEFGKTQI